ncbi:hypothetical protein LU298_10715 [Komagataeibacter intermedius]|uniref:Uncharacterized protein n=1 Tax=Komagataeibacter intermedius AF2 TaxID=1458464 RepID=A0A0N1FKS7_9PROT|nr:hypothetical protein [Komagataeibacter intermedius]KPH86718.1 hypothetical protein GLUCOINTEAF2_0200636 [Komagataeibacter intermedius AF2]MCF3636966.1 hypothetical protein [Komagataeibacter intermedius]
MTSPALMGLTREILPVTTAPRRAATIMCANRDVFHVFMAGQANPPGPRPEPHHSC